MNMNKCLEQKPSICFVALNAYGVLSGQKDFRRGGGAEVQQVRIASWLVQQGYSVSFITLDHGQRDGTIINGIRLYKAYVLDTGIRGLRFIYPYWSDLWSAMARANADIYYQRTTGCETGQVALWCRMHHRKFIFAVASDLDCDSSLRMLKSLWERILSNIGLKLANCITTQTARQQALLRQDMGVDRVLIPNCGWDLGEDVSVVQSYNSASEILRILWVGRISKEKRLEWFLDVAQRCPEMIFDVVGAANMETDYVSSLVGRASRISNVKMHGRVPYSEMDKYYQNCHVLCCTSAYEGFPNTFIEAWSFGIPVVSTVDPDGVIATNCLGWVACDVEEIAVCLREVIRRPAIWHKASKAAKQYYLENHTQEICLPRFEHLLRGLVGN